MYVGKLLTVLRGVFLPVTLCVDNQFDIILDRNLAAKKDNSRPPMVTEEHCHREYQYATSDGKLRRWNYETIADSKVHWWNHKTIAESQLKSQLTLSRHRNSLG